jgi:hypothetical protein
MSLAVVPCSTGAAASTDHMIDLQIRIDEALHVRKIQIDAECPKNPNRE